MSESSELGPSPGALSRERVLAEAIRLADAAGVEAVTMRRLARQLGAGAMSLYHYVTSKDDLLDGMVDLVVAEIEPAPADVEWREAVRRRSASVRRVLLRHAWAIPLMESRSTPGPANLRHREALTACLRRAGFSIEMTTHATWLLDSYVYGFVLQEASLPFASAAELADRADDFLAQLPADTYPYARETASVLLALGYDPAREFAFGLDVILDALERLRGRGSANPEGG